MVPPGIWLLAEVQVRRIFQHAGVEILWRNCSERSMKSFYCGLPRRRIQSSGSETFLRVARSADRNDVLGTATLE